MGPTAARQLRTRAKNVSKEASDRSSSLHSRKFHSRPRYPSRVTQAMEASGATAATASRT